MILVQSVKNDKMRKNELIITSSEMVKIKSNE